MVIRVAQIVPYKLPAYSGVLGAMIGLSCALTRRSVDVDIWHLDTWPHSANNLFDQLHSANIGRADFSEFGLSWELIASLRRNVVQRNIQAVYLHGAFSPLNNVLAKVLPVPYIVTPHGGYSAVVLRHHQIRKQCYLQLCDLPMLRRASAICALSEAERNDLAQLGIGDTVQVAPYGVDPILPQLNRETFREQIGLGHQAHLAVFVGRLDVYYKNLELLVRGMSVATEWHLVLMGPDFKGGYDLLRNLIRRLQLEHRVYLVEPRRGKGLHEVLASADVFILVSRSEGLPVALLEALCHGVPAVVSPAVERVLGVARFGAGWLVGPEQVGSQLQTLTNLDWREWCEHRVKAKEFAELFAWDRVIGLHERVLKAAIKVPK